MSTLETENINHLMETYASLKCKKLEGCGEEYIVWSVLMDVFRVIGWELEKEILNPRIEELKNVSLNT